MVGFWLLKISHQFFNILALLILNIAFWLYLATKKKAVYLPPPGPRAICWLELGRFVTGIWGVSIWILRQQSMLLLYSPNKFPKKNQVLEGKSIWGDAVTHGPTTHVALVYLWRKVVCFVLWVWEIYWTGMLQIVFLACLESSRWLWGERCMGLLVPWHLDLWCKSSWILNDFFIEN